MTAGDAFFEGQGAAFSTAAAGRRMHQTSGFVITSILVRSRSFLFSNFAFTRPGSPIESGHRVELHLSGPTGFWWD
jgi:hypothetical protein